MLFSFVGAGEELLVDILFEVGGDDPPVGVRYFAVESGSLDLRSSGFGGIGLGERCVITICGCGLTTAFGFSGLVVRQPAGGRSAAFSDVRLLLIAEALKFYFFITQFKFFV